MKNKKKVSTWFHVGVYCKNLNGERGKFGRKAFAMLMRNCWILFERVYVTANGRYKQSRDDYFSFSDLLLRLYFSLEQDLEKLTAQAHPNPQPKNYL